MRTHLLFCAALFLGTVSLSAQTITPDEAAKHIGEKVTICGKVFGGRFFDSKITLLNMGAAYPNSPVTVLIEADNRKNFTGAPENDFTNKEVCVTGFVKDYKGKPEIVITKQEDIVLKK